MLIPQVRLGIAEQRRPDFVAYVPLQKWKYRPLAVELDRSHGEDRAEEDYLRDMDLTNMGFQMIPVKPGDGRSIRELKKLIVMIDSLMTKADRDPRSVAVEVQAELEMERQALSF